MTEGQIARHNQLQREYFGRRVKPTMRPARTPYVMRHLQELIGFGALQPGDRILEVGCGMGRHAFLLAELGFVVEGLELSPFLIEKFQEFSRGGYAIPVYCGDIHDPPAELCGPYDALVGFFVLHHLADLSRAFRSMAGLLKPGGKAIFLEPNPYNPLYYLQILITPGMSWRAERGLLNMRPTILFPAMGAAGFGELSLRRFGFFPPLLANTRWGRRLETILESFPLWQHALPFQLFRGVLAGRLS